ncbi:MAG TPA: hypothetical protein ENO21_02860, partial [Firmicutes bacterium]|nr:hypothetical protein [Bacillota bacterium]
TPLHRATDAAPEVVAYLLEHGADVHAETESGSTALTMFTHSIPPETVQLLIDYGADVNHRSEPDDDTALHEAVSNIAVMQVLIDNGADVNAHGFMGETALQRTTGELYSGMIPDDPDDPAEIARFLVSSGAEVDARNDHNRTPLMQCTDPALIAVLIELGADVNARDDEGDTVLHQHCDRWAQDPAVLETLIAHGAQIEALDDDGNTPLHTAIGNQNDMAVAVLREAGATVDLAAAAGLNESETLSQFYRQSGYVEAHPGEATRAITLAAINGHVQVVDDLLAQGARPTLCDMARLGYIGEMRKLIDSGADVNEVIGNRDTPLNYAAAYGQNEAVRLLVESGADLNGHGYRNRTPIACATRDDHFDTLRLLLELGADPDEPVFFGGTALHWATDYESARALIDAGADINARSDDGRTPLMHAVQTSQSLRRGDTGVVQLLIDSGADLDLQDDRGSAAVHEAVGIGPDVSNQPLRQILEAGATPDLVNELGFTPLWWAVAMGNQDAVKLLLEHGADPNFTSEWGGTAMLAAAQAGDDELMELLRKHGAEEPSEEALSLLAAPDGML